MILIDLNQVCIAGVMAHLNFSKTKNPDADLLRHMIFNIIRTQVKKFRKEYGEVILCCDNRHYWRKDVFPYYKAGRKKSREKSDLDWNMIFNLLDEIRSDLREHFPYKVINVDGAEADDIIGTLAPRAVSHENVVIVSKDGDFLQLQRHNGKHTIKQWDSVGKKFLVSDNPALELKEKIIRGDAGDGIPNIFSASDSFVNNIKQKAVTKGKLETCLYEEIDKWEDQYAVTNFDRNRRLIDLSYTPVDIKQAIINTYEDSKPASRSKLLNYFMTKKLMNLMDVIEDF